LDAPSGIIVAGIKAPAIESVHVQILRDWKLSVTNHLGRHGYRVGVTFGKFGPRPQLSGKAAI